VFYYNNYYKASWKLKTKIKIRKRKLMEDGLKPSTRNLWKDFKDLEEIGLVYRKL
jgi:hypothetical protein